MSTAPVARRLAAIGLPIVVVVVLFFIGRRATNAAIVSIPTNDATAATEIAPVDAPSSEPTPPDAARPALEVMADGAVIVDLNLATESDLRKLPGVGPTRAKKIVDLRAKLGRFKSIDDLARIKGFGRATLRRLRPLTRASPP